MKEIGSIIQARRKELGLTVEDVKRQIYVSSAYIYAIEEGDVSKFPAEVYYTGTLRRYGILLGLNTDELISQYTNSKLKAQAEAIKIENEKKEFSPVYVIAALVLISGVAIIYLSSKKPHCETLKPVAAIAATQQVVLQSKSVEEDSKSPLMLAILGTSGSWVSVYADDEKVFEGLIAGGMLKKFGAKYRFHLKIGYVSGISVTLNNKSVNITTGARQDINEIILTNESIKK